MESARANRWLVQAVPEAIGGDGPGTIQSPPLPPLPPAPPWAGDFEPGFEVDWQSLLPNPLNVEAGRNQCAPAAYANALAYLDATFGHLGIQFPQQHIPGVAIDGDENSLVSRVDWYMDRPAVSTCIGEATNRCGDAFAENPSSAIRGLFEYLYLFESDQRVAVRHQASQAVLPGGCGLDEALDRESVRDGAQVSFDWLCDRVQEGAGVVMSFGYYTQAQFEGGIQLPGEELDLWQRTGGHVVRVFGCGEIAGKKFIRTLDDGQQDRMIDTDADDEVDTCEARGGLRQQLWFLDQGSIEGRLLLGSDSRQIEFALALTPAL